SSRPSAQAAKARRGRDRRMKMVSLRFLNGRAARVMTGMARSGGPWRLAPRAIWEQTNRGELARDEEPQRLRQLRAIASNRCSRNMEVARRHVKERSVKPR